MAVRELPGGVSWRDKSYEAFASPMFVLRDALVHSSAGILAVGNTVIEETLVHTSPRRNHFSRDGNRVELRGTRSQNLPGRHVGLLSGASRNYFHLMIDSIARLAVLESSGLDRRGRLLLPTSLPIADEILQLLQWNGDSVRHVSDDETFLVEELVLPWTVHGQSCYHPCIKKFLYGLSKRVPVRSEQLPRKLYLSRTTSKNRQLLNEVDLISELEKHGFTAVNLEELSFETQIRLIRGADIIVAPHGAGLSNMIFASPHTRFLEIMMDSYVNWCFRRLAGMLCLTYDCVIGRAVGDWKELSPQVHGSKWFVSIPHVIAAVDQMARQVR